MSERTVIGGTTYESIGSSSSNLLLKCNGTARILWGSKLIDLIKNGKLASGEFDVVSIVSDKLDIVKNGLYLLLNDNTQQLWAAKDGATYNLSESTLTISTESKQNLSVEQQKQALENIGIYYNTLDDVKKSSIENGIVYVLEDKNLYTIKSGVIEEFEAKMKTVTVETLLDVGEVLDNDVKIMLSINGVYYMVLSENVISIDKDILVNDNAKICSKNATSLLGYKLYIKDGISYLEVDKINVRHGIDDPNMVYTTVVDFENLINNNNLKPQCYYMLLDYLNPWKLIENFDYNNRPIVVRARTSNSIYRTGYLYDNQNVIILYDNTVSYPINIVRIIEEDGELKEEVISSTKARGCITYMKDEFGNEANFDFLDYTIGDITTHYSDSNFSIFPSNSYNNKLTVHNLYGTVFKEGNLVTELVSKINFKTNNPIYPSLKLDVDGSYIKVGLSHYEYPYESLLFIFTCDPSASIKDVEDMMSEGESTNLSRLETESGTLITYLIPPTLCNDRNCDFLLAMQIVSEESVAVTNCQIQFSDVKVVIGDESYTLNRYDNGINIDDEGTLTLVSTTSNSTEDIPAYDTTYKVMHDNDITCSGNLTIDVSCNSFCNNTIKNIIGEVVIQTNMENNSFETINECTFEAGNTINNVICTSQLNDTIFSESKNPQLYNPNERKDVYVSNGNLVFKTSSNREMIRGMIIMYDGSATIPPGWAVCDGKSHEYEGQTITTPNLVGRFIKAVGENDVIGEGGNGTISILESNLPIKIKMYDLTESSEGTAVYTSSETPGDSISMEPSYYSLIFIMKL